MQLLEHHVAVGAIGLSIGAMVVSGDISGDIENSPDSSSG